MLVDIASKGGNLLLNVGPTAEGLIPDSSVVRLKEIGNWMKHNGESIYGTSASPFFKLPWGRCTQKEIDGDTYLYFHVFDWPKHEVLIVPGIKTRVANVGILSYPKAKLAWRFKNGDLWINIPKEKIDLSNTVIVVKTKGKVKVTSNMPTLDNGKIYLPADFADIHNPGYGKHAILEVDGKNSFITNWVDSRTKLEWMFNTNAKGKYEVFAQVYASEVNHISIEIDKSGYETKIQDTLGEYKRVKLGEVEISELGDKTIVLKPVRSKWNSMALVNVELVKK